ncbi:MULTISPECIES: SPOR domain-containing protein [Microvirgula]|nr:MULTISPECIES: SPOR domain-containing protein [Microvirgula]RAS15578.1 cell division protein FtsN [Microvirgula sp. AG722]
MASRDYKNAGRSQSRPSGRSSKPQRDRSGGGMGAGILIGVIAGVGIAVGVAFWLNRAASPFADREKPRTPTTAAEVAPPQPSLLEPGTLNTRAPEVKTEGPTQGNVVVLPPPDKAPGAPAPAAKPAAPATPDYDFYQLLADKDGKLPAEKPAARKPAEKSDKAGKPVFFQLGAFSSENEADNLKARLALSGIEASISSTTIPDKGLLHRVRVGPYSRPEDINRVKALLKNEGFNPSVVKADG